MGRAKRKALQRKKRIEKRRSGKLVRFVLANSSKKYQGWSDRYSYQSNLHNLIYKDGVFSNDKFQNCILTECNFKKSTFIGVDFTHCNLKDCKFQNAVLTDVTFFNCKMKDVDFQGAVFKNVVFMCMNVSTIKNLPQDGFEIITTYPTIQNQYLIQAAQNLSLHKPFYKYHVLNISTKKINKWYLSLLVREYANEGDLTRALFALGRRKDKRFFITISSYKKYIDKYLKL